MSDESDNDRSDESNEDDNVSESSETSEKVTYMKKLSEILESFGVCHIYFSNVNLIRVNKYSPHLRSIYETYALPNNNFDPHNAIVTDCYCYGPNWPYGEPHFVIKCENDEVFKIEL
jgi:hypothetical protein